MLSVPLTSMYCEWEQKRSLASLLSPISSLLSPLSYLLSPVSCLLSPVSCLLSPVSCLLSPLPSLPTKVCTLRSHALDGTRRAIDGGVQWPSLPLGRCERRDGPSSVFCTPWTSLHELPYTLMEWWIDDLLVNTTHAHPVDVILLCHGVEQLMMMKMMVMIMICE